MSSGANQPFLRQPFDDGMLVAPRPFAPSQKKFRIYMIKVLIVPRGPAI